MKLTRKQREAIIKTVDRWERIAAGRDCKKGCALCLAFGGSASWIKADCSKCPVVKVFGHNASWEGSAPCTGFLSGGAALTATGAAMLAAVLGVDVPRKEE